MTAEQTLLANEETAVSILQNRFVASVNLVEALGGGWDVSELPDYEQLRHWHSCVDVVGAIRGNVDTELPPVPISLFFRHLRGGRRLDLPILERVLPTDGRGNAQCLPASLASTANGPQGS